MFIPCIGQIEGDARVSINQNTYPGANIMSISGPGLPQIWANVGTGVPTPGSVGNVYAETDGLEIQPGTINDLRRAMRLQEWLEKNARGGTRYVENILTHFGVKSSDARLQRPEYITGIKTPIVISEVLNTTGEASRSCRARVSGGGIPAHICPRLLFTV